MLVAVISSLTVSLYAATGHIWNLWPLQRRREIRVRWRQAGRGDRKEGREDGEIGETATEGGIRTVWKKRSSPTDSSKWSR